MSSEATRIAICLGALLGQSFSFLYGRPRQMLTAEAYHGTLCSLARRSGLLGLVSQGHPTYDDIGNSGSELLEHKWRTWGRQEMLKRSVMPHSSVLKSVSNPLIRPCSQRRPRYDHSRR